MGNVGKQVAMAALVASLGVSAGSVASLGVSAGSMATIGPATPSAFEPFNIAQYQGTKRRDTGGTDKAVVERRKRAKAGRKARRMNRKKWKGAK